MSRYFAKVAGFQVELSHLERLARSPRLYRILKKNSFSVVCLDEERSPVELPSTRREWEKVVSDSSVPSTVEPACWNYSAADLGFHDCRRTAVRGCARGFLFDLAYGFRGIKCLYLAVHSQVSKQRIMKSVSYKKTNRFKQISNCKWQVEQ